MSVWVVSFESHDFTTEWPLDSFSVQIAASYLILRTIPIIYVLHSISDYIYYPSNYPIIIQLSNYYPICNIREISGCG